MHVKSISIEHIRSIERFQMDFDKDLAGWHVLIGDNGAGKSTIIRAIALGVLGLENARALSSFEDFSTWLPPQVQKGEIEINLLRDENFDLPRYKGKQEVKSTLSIDRIVSNGKVQLEGQVKPKNALWGDYSGASGWFLCAYGPFRRLRGGSSEIFSHLPTSKPRLGACLSAFRDDFALTQLTAWLKDLALDASKKTKAKSSLEGIVNFINEAKLLPNQAQLLNDIDSEGIKLQDAKGIKVSLFEMSDGYRSVLSMTMDILRFLIEIYGVEKVFPEGLKQTAIPLPGVVLIDEVDAHLHPTWQTRIGKWFTQYFPNIQFIVTTHSPLVCRACEKGSIWRLATPGSEQTSGPVTGLDFQRLVYGNILDAYGTEVFGEDVSQGQEGQKLLEELARLNRDSFKGKLDEKGRKRLEEIKRIMPTYDTTE